MDQWFTVDRIDEDTYICAFGNRSVDIFLHGI